MAQIPEMNASLAKFCEQYLKLKAVVTLIGWVISAMIARCGFCTVGISDLVVISLQIETVELIFGFCGGLMIEWVLMAEI